MKNNKATMHHFDIEDAMKYGVEKAVVLSNIRFWLNNNKNKDLSSVKHDGHYWMYNTAKDMSNVLPYFTQSKIQRLLKQLEDDGVLIVGNYNKVKYDRTKWYTLSEFTYDENFINHKSELNIENDSIEQPIQDSKTNTKNNNKINILNDDILSVDNLENINIPFDSFWDLYDYKKNKSLCITKWHSMTNEERTLTIESLEVYKQSTPDKTYRKYPLNYLENECWNDEHIVLVDNQNIAHNNKNTITNNNVFSASHKEFEPVISLQEAAQDTSSTKHTKDDLECNLEALGISSGKGLDDRKTKDCTINNNNKNINTPVDIVALSSQIHWSELKARGMLKNPVNTNAVIPNTDTDKKINEFLARNSSKRFGGICKDIA
ncbi:Replication initialization protein [Psychrobacter phage D'Alembert]|nr:Replication initialization protein [Psychrobacter phage D'Alembert]